MKTRRLASTSKARILRRSDRWLAGVATGLLAIGLAVPQAFADPDDGDDEDLDGQIHTLRTELADSASTVGEVEVALADQNLLLEQAQIDSLVAQEDYAEALDEVDEREEESERSQEQAEEAEDKAETARKDLARAALQANRSGTSLTQIEAFITADGFDNIVARSEAYSIVGNHVQEAEQSLRSSQLVADTMSKRADRAVTAAQDAADRADHRLQEMEEAVDTAEQAVTVSEETRTDLLTEMADLRGTTLELEEEREREKEEARIERAQQQMRERPSPDDVVQADNPQPSSSTSSGSNSSGSSSSESSSPSPSTSSSSSTATPTPTSTPSSTKTSKPKPTKTQPPKKPGGGNSQGNAAKGKAAVDWARKQIGKPYLLGASGPEKFDCSGLTSQAWLNAANRNITRTSRSQYQAVKKISYSEMRPGDLIFWARNPSDPGSIYHVAMYTGNNQMIEALNPQTPLRETTFASWGVSDMMAYAGRP